MSHNSSLALSALGAVLYLAALAQVVYVPWLASRWKRGGCAWLLAVLVIDLGWFVVSPFLGLYGFGFSAWGIPEVSYLWIIGNVLALSPVVALWMAGPSYEARQARRRPRYRRLRK